MGLVLATGLACIVASLTLAGARVGAAVSARRDAGAFLTDTPFQFSRPSRLPRRPEHSVLAILGRRCTPAGRRHELETLVARAGGTVTLDQLFARSVVGGVAGLGVGLYAALVDVRVGLSMAVIGAFCGWLLPGLALRRAGDSRADAVRRALPDALDVLAISMEAGVGLEGAIANAANDLGAHPLGVELRRVVQELDLGLSRREALLALKQRVGVSELTSFVMALLQADSLGISLGRILRTEAKEMRGLRRRLAREQAARTPVRLLFPLVFGIFPALLVVILGPAGIQMMTVFR